MASVTVSVALATFNGERFLPEQLDSLCNQTSTPHELVVCDDGSSDATVQMVRDFAARAPFPVHIHSNGRRLGYRDNFLRAAGLCTGHLVAYCDQDDVWLPLKIARCAEAFAVAEPPSVVVHSYAVVDERLAPTRTAAPRFGPPGRTTPQDCPLFASHNGSAMCFDRALLGLVPNDMRPEDVHASACPMSHDKWILFLAGIARGVEVLPDSLMLYRQHGGNLAGASPNNMASQLSYVDAAGYVHYRRLARLSSERADVLDRAVRGGRLDASLQHGAQERARAYRRSAQFTLRRARLYASRRPVRWRTGQVIRLGIARSYRHPLRGGLGARAAVKDVVVAVAGPDAFRPLGRASAKVRCR